LAKQTKEFDWKKLPKELRVAVDSRPLEGAGRVEDTINLLGRAARKIVRVAAKLMKLPVEAIAQQARIPLVLGGSTKAALDRDWSDPEQRAEAIEELVGQLASLLVWLDRTQLQDDIAIEPYVEALEQVLVQDIEWDEHGRARIIPSPLARNDPGVLAKNDPPHWIATVNTIQLQRTKDAGLPSPALDR
jgi:hypothetical protein